MLALLETIWIYDGLINPPHPKMVVCMSPEDGWFFRINSRPHFKPCVPLLREPDHQWLDHDSHLQCSILMLDDYVVDAAIERNGVVGSVSLELREEIIRGIMAGRDTPPRDKQRLCDLLNAAG